MYQFVFGFINITDLSIDVEWQVCTTFLVSQLSPFVSDLIFVYALIISLLLTSKSQNMIHPDNGSRLSGTATSGLEGRVPQLQIKLLTQLQKAFCFLLFWILSRLFP